MLRRSDVEFKVTEATRFQDGMRVSAKVQACQIMHYDPHKTSDAEFELLKDQLFENIRREFYGVLEIEILKLESQILRNTNVSITAFNKIKDLLKCKSDT